MDNLRLILKALFQHRQLLLAQWLKWKLEDQPHRGISDAKSFAYELRTMGTPYTLDELQGVVAETKEIWMQRGSDTKLAYCPESSVFNVLLHFTSPLLYLDNYEPRCRYEGLLRWHDLTQYLGEDLLLTSYMASRDVITRTERHSFLWDEYVPHDNKHINSILDKNTAELHAHLNGSSFGFALNWICMMNQPENAYSVFEKDKALKYRLFPNAMLYHGEDSLQLLTAKAAVIRFYLISTIEHSSAKKNIDRLLRDALSCEDENQMKTWLSHLQSYINTYIQQYTLKYDVWGGQYTIDYAIQSNKNADTETIRSDKAFMSVLSGERWFLYSVLRKIYIGSEDLNNIDILLFYIYLLIKNKFRREYIQLNSYNGFQNFADYQDRKTLFLKGEVYEKLNTMLAVQSYFLHSPNRHLEMRIAPRDTESAMFKTIEDYDRSQRFDISKTPVKASKQTLCNYIVHFIKKLDGDGVSEHQCRNKKIRDNTETQAKALAQLMTHKNIWEQSRIVGIDAANSEFCCRPEVFAQVFRYMKLVAAENGVHLGQTFHVGEDFYDIVDGLRAIDEVLLYLQFKTGSRIGHGLALGTEVKKYYKQRHNTVVIPAQILLDNIVWLHEQSLSLSDKYHAEREWLDHEYERVFRTIYTHWAVGPIPSIYTYYQAWMLRGDNPECYRDAKRQPALQAFGSQWNRCSLVCDDTIDNIRSHNNEARLLYHLYHFDIDAKANGRRTIQWIFRKDLNVYGLIDDVRELMLDKVESKHLHIECNPTSNLRIGSFTRYDELPVSKFFNYGLSNVPDRSSHGISISINTDDKGVFATSLEREYSLIALAEEKRLNNDGSLTNQPLQVYDWIDRIRQMAVDAAF